VAERPRGCLQSNYTPVQIRTLAYAIFRDEYGVAKLGRLPKLNQHLLANTW
jgi:hypothetical protein